MTQSQPQKQQAALIAQAKATQAANRGAQIKKEKEAILFKKIVSSP
tara:strand:- start:2708 stop:2845 length:138 start_codon:yes stop_codon:yes gene_type:complete